MLGVLYAITLRPSVGRVDQSITNATRTAT